MCIEEKLNNVIQKLKINNIEDANLKSKMLFSHILKMRKEQLLINNKQELKEEELKQIDSKVQQIIKGKPIQYIINKQEFMGIDFYVDENVLIPQPDTEILVEEVIKQSKYYNKSINILDLCTGSGAIAISIAKNIENVKIVASDISESALKVAKKNAIKNKIEIKFIKSNIFNNINEKFDIIVSNPPYIETENIENLSKEVKNEPKIALDGGKDGLDFYKEISKNAFEFLKNNGKLIFEIGYNQKESVIKILSKTNKYKNIKCIKDYSGNDRVIKCEKL